MDLLGTSWILFKVTMVTTKSYQGYYYTPKLAKSWPKQQNKISEEARSWPAQRAVASSVTEHGISVKWNVTRSGMLVKMECQEK